MRKILNFLANIFLFRHLRAKYHLYRLRKTIEADLVEEFLDLLLKAMSLVFCISRSFRRNIKNFNGRYLFKTKDNTIAVAAIFKDEKMDVREEQIQDTDLTFIFKTPKAIVSFLASTNPDILNAILTQDVVTDGNFNYMYKFTYMARHIQLKAMETLTFL